MTSTELSFVSSVTDLIWPDLVSSWVRNCEKLVLSALSPFEISFEAKNARTITMMIGKAALLKKRVMGAPAGRERG